MWWCWRKDKTCKEWCIVCRWRKLCKSLDNRMEIKFVNTEPCGCIDIKVKTWGNSYDFPLCLFFFLWNRSQFIAEREDGGRESKSFCSHNMCLKKESPSCKCFSVMPWDVYVIANLLIILTFIYLLHSLSHLFFYICKMGMVIHILEYCWDVCC